MGEVKPYTSYPGVNKLLDKFVSNVNNILKQQLVSIYILGSLAVGDFNLNSSDIDFLVITETNLKKEIITYLRNMHYELVSNNPIWGDRLEGSYISKDKLKEFQPPENPRPYIHKGQLKLLRYGNEWIIEKYVLKKHGMILKGEDLRSEIKYIKQNDLKRVTLKILYNWWKPMINNKSKLYDDEYQAYAVLSMCRVIYTLHHGTVVSKPKAARWVKKELSEKWDSLINDALMWSKDMKFNRIDEIVKFIKYTIQYSQQFNNLLED
ncbi:hypothetical protein U472_11510 [Orenia metallireducens]|uniref:Adenylyltransferase AadA C-terminal domain-containing protein n=1 Tax=Orenia metallireducens TaxID=1413210 RepID=A0A1C0A8R0_9FIRM|nr:nucleotidyltransferase domain-containing protein [Orenia metallireducens]OCL26604.1 hypothetical protein U472_11510 [Orenia metallireducens]